MRKKEKTMNIKEFINFIEENFGPIGDEEGLKYGNEKEEIKGITTCWMATEKIIENAGKKNHNFIISHEEIIFPPEYAWKDKESEEIVSKRRAKLLDKYKINVVRIHSTADKYFISKEFGNLFGFKKIIIQDGIFFIYEIEPTKFGELCKKVKGKIDTEYIRVCGNDYKVIKKVGNLVGGLGLSINASFIDRVLKYNVDMVIVGEFDEYTERALFDVGVCGIEIGHERSEQPGLIEFTNFLKRQLEGIEVEYKRNEFPWRIL